MINTDKCFTCAQFFNGITFVDVRSKKIDASKTSIFGAFDFFFPTSMNINLSPNFAPKRNFYYNRNQSLF